ncbi:MAG: leucine-rich repeat domain-containing protein, partial [Ureaplasma sp.]|nr:leucine-rich repeat domain-containing protein [Ureaplasma sp.]
NITFTNDLLKIQPNTLFKFIPESPNNIVVNENIQIQNLMFYTGLKFINLDNFYNVINNYITNSSRKFTTKEFGQDLKTNLDSLKLLIAKNLSSEQGTNIGVNEINSLELNSDNNLVITLNTQSTQYFKYAVQENNNVFLEDGNKLIIKNLTYYTDLTISDANLASVWQTLNNFVIDNQISYSSDGDINNYLNSSIWNIIKDINTIDGLKLENFINKPTNSEQIISVTLKSGMYKMKSKNLNSSSIIIENNSKISFNQLYIQSPTTWFSWNGNGIIGLSSKGQNLVNTGTRNFVLPVKTTSIRGFSGYNFGVEKIDMSYSNITSIDSNSFHNNNDLLTLLLPKKLTSIGYDAFDGTRKLTTVFLPSSLSSCGSNAFNRDGLPDPNRFSNFYVESSEAKSKFINLITSKTPSNYFFIGNTSNIYYFY